MVKHSCQWQLYLGANRKPSNKDQGQFNSRELIPGTVNLANHAQPVSYLLLSMGNVVKVKRFIESFLESGH